MAFEVDLKALTQGDRAAWDAFVRRYSGLVMAAVRGVARERVEIEDLTQDVFTRLCKDGFRLLKTFDPSRAGMSTWLTIVARSTARDMQRRRQLALSPLDNVPESALATSSPPPERLSLPKDLLSPRQALVLSLLYERDMDVAEIAAALAIDPQTVRSTHHKAMLKLRAHFAEEKGDGG